VTQPQQADTGGGNLIAAAAIGLALIAIESQTRQQVQDATDTAFTTIAAVAVTTASTAPATVITGVALLSLTGMHTAITSNLTQAQQQIRAAITAGYTSAAHTTFAKLSAELGDGAPTTLPPLGDNLDRLLSDIDTMLGHAHTDLQNSIAAAFDGIQGPNPTAARLVAIGQAVKASQARTGQRAQATAGVAVQAAETDVEQAVFDHYQNTTGIPGLMKRWVVASSNPCGMCEALNGTTVGVNAEFDHNATTDEKDYRRVWRNLIGPPRHPNCRCQLELVTT
jgi:hypothetical protein